MESWGNLLFSLYCFQRDLHICNSAQLNRQHGQQWTTIYESMNNDMFNKEQVYIYAPMNKDKCHNDKCNGEQWHVQYWTMTCERMT